jgi:hypothetical protein
MWWDKSRLKKAWRRYRLGRTADSYENLCERLEACLPGHDVRGEHELSTDEQYQLWGEFGALCAHNPSPEFAVKGLMRGEFSPELAKAVSATMDAQPQIPYEMEDFPPGYYGNTSTVVGLVETYNRIFAFRNPQPIFQMIAGAIDGELIRRALGFDFRVVQLRYWESLPGGEGIGTNGWHTDGFPPYGAKILCYFSDFGGDLGTTRFRLLDGTEYEPSGRAGTWHLFKNSDVPHCGIAPKTGRRKTVEIILGPSLVTDCLPVFAGTNGHYPMRPWHLI